MSVELSVCIIACNEEQNIRRCLESVAWAADRVVVLDTRSSDRTDAIAAELGARVIVNPYAGNIEQKNFALAQAKYDWVFSLDADEACTPPLQREVQAIITKENPRAIGYEVNRLTYHLGRWLRHGDFYPDWQLRLFRRSEASWQGINPHGRVVLQGEVRRLRGELEHYSYRNLADQVARIQEFSRVQALALRDQGVRASWSMLALRPPLRFARAYWLKAGFLDGVAGFVVAAATAFHVFLKYAKLWELQTLASGAEAERAAGKAVSSAPVAPSAAQRSKV